jgi:hypothetical protein
MTVLEKHAGTGKPQTAGNLLVSDEASIENIKEQEIIPLRCILT